MFQSLYKSGFWMSTPQVEYVPVGDTIADIALSQKASASLTATTSILLAVLIAVSFVVNIALLAAILSR